MVDGMQAFSAVFDRGLIEASFTGQRFGGCRKFSAVFDRGLIEAWAVAHRPARSGPGFPRSSTAASLKQLLEGPRVLAVDGFPRSSTAASLKLDGLDAGTCRYRRFPRSSTAASLKQCRAPPGCCCHSGFPALLKQVWVESEPIRRVHEARLTAKRQLGTDPRIPLPGRACGGLLRMWGGVATGRPACQRATRVLRCAPVLRMTRRPSLRSESSYGPCGPAWTGASRPSTTSRRTREEQSARGPDVRGSRGEAEPANAGVFLAGAASNWGHPYPHLFQETRFSAVFDRGLIEAPRAGLVRHDEREFSAVFDRGLIEACSSHRSRLPATEFSAVFDRGLIEALRTFDSLKLPRSFSAVFDRGLIEAPLQQQRKGLHTMFSAVFDRGLIEAASKSKPASYAPLFSAVFDRGLIEALWRWAGMPSSWRFSAVFDRGLIEARNHTDPRRASGGFSAVFDRGLIEALSAATVLVKLCPVFRGLRPRPH